MLFAQLNAFEKAISDALADNHQSLVIISWSRGGQAKIQNPGKTRVSSESKAV